MHDRQLRRFRAAVRLGAYELTYHGLDEMEQDRLSVLDLEYASSPARSRTGNGIGERASGST